MNEEEAYCQVAAEVSKGELKTGLWTKALAESVGNENVAKSLYLKFRAQQLLSEHRVAEKSKAKRDFQANVAAAKERTLSLVRRVFLFIFMLVSGLVSLGGIIVMFAGFSDGSEEAIVGGSILTVIFGGLAALSIKDFLYWTDINRGEEKPES